MAKQPSSTPARPRAENDNWNGAATPLWIARKAKTGHAYPPVICAALPEETVELVIVGAILHALNDAEARKAKGKRARPVLLGVQQVLRRSIDTGPPGFDVVLEAAALYVRAIRTGMLP